VVFDCTLPEIHHQVTMTALAHGCHVLGEKPLADTMAHAREMVAAADQAGKLYAVIQNRRYDPRIRSLRRFLDSGRIGQVTTVNADFYIGAHFGGFRDQMQHVLLLDMAIHSFDQARLISGADPVAVYCHEWNPLGSWYKHGASAIAIFEMSNGLRLTYRGSWCAEGMNTTWECDWRVIGTNGGVKWDGADKFEAEAVVKTGGFFSEKEKLTIPVEPDGKLTGHAGLLREFIDCVKTGGTPETIAKDNIKSLAMVFGAIESAETGRRVEIAG
jgi:predicted dehydrogenase